MRILVCDDDALMVEQIKKCIKNYFERNHLKCPEVICFFDGESLLADTGDKDILFLDIEMPGMNGIYVGNELKKANSQIIIFVVTSYSEYLDAAMRFHVFRYLSKPLDKQRFYDNMKDAIDLYNTMYNHFTPLCFYRDNRGSRKRMYSLTCFNRKFDCHSVI